MASVRIKRGNRDQINTARNAGGLLVGEQYLVSDSAHVGVALASDDYRLVQNASFMRPISFWQANPQGTQSVSGAGHIFGTQTWTSVGTQTVRALAASNLLTRSKRLGFVSAATAGAMTEHRLAGNPLVSTGNGGGLGGFFYSGRFAIADAAVVAGARGFHGLIAGNAAATNVEPDSLINCIGVAQLSTDATQLYLVYGGSSAQAAIPLGVNFPPMNGVGESNGILYQLTINASPDANGVIRWMVERLGTSFFINGVITPATPGVQTPLSSVFMNPKMWRTNNATALAVAFDHSLTYIETDY